MKTNEHSVWIPGNVPSSKNSRRFNTKSKHSFDSKPTAQYKRKRKQDWIRNRKRFLELIEDEAMPYRIMFTFVRDSRRKFDYVNPLQTVQDLMVSHKWISDDNMTILIPVFGEYKYDKDSPGVLIEILEG